MAAKLCNRIGMLWFTPLHSLGLTPGPARLQSNHKSHLFTRGKEHSVLNNLAKQMSILSLAPKRSRRTKSDVFSKHPSQRRKSLQLYLLITVENKPVPLYTVKPVNSAGNKHTHGCLFQGRKTFRSTRMGKRHSLPHRSALSHVEVWCKMGPSLLMAYWPFSKERESFLKAKVPSVNSQWDKFWGLYTFKCTQSSQMAKQDTGRAEIWP